MSEQGHEHGHTFGERVEERMVHMLEDHPDDHPHHTHGGIGQYLMVFLALCVLTGASFFTYSSYWPFSKEVAWAFMMAVSCTKAMLVIMFFMHLLWEANWKWVLTIPASGMSLFLLLMLIPDVGMRQDNGWAWYSRDRWLFAADRPAVQASDVEALEKEEAAKHPPEQPAPTH
jgi:cytochrome c oxidase subunit IV